MSEEKKITEEDIDKAVVKLKPIAGVSPRTYLSVLYGLLVCLVVFVVFFLPGLLNPGSVLDFLGTPGNCAVYVDGVFKGSTNQSIFLRPGNYKIKIEHSGFSTKEIDAKVSGKVFGTLFSASKYPVAYELEADKPGDFLASAFSDYAAWSLSGTPSALYQLPMVLSRATRDLASSQVLERMDKNALLGSGSGSESESGSGSESGLLELFNPNNATQTTPPQVAFAKDVLSMTTSPVAARDGLNASVTVVANGRLGPLSLVASARTLSSMLSGSTAGSVWLKDMLSQKSYSHYETLEGVAKKAIPDLNSVPRVLGRQAFMGHSFVFFDAGTFILAGQAPSGSFAPYSVQLPSFGLATTEVTNAQWLRFLQENPQWKPENRDALIAQGLADEDYLLNFKGEANNLPVVQISWYAAQAYCNWLTKRAPAGYCVVLPDEAMWEIAARVGINSAHNSTATGKGEGVWASPTRTGPEAVGSLGASSIGLSDMLGNVWEWTNDAYRPYPAFAAGAFWGKEKAVRGGSWANSKDSITVYSRGGVADRHASEFLGFRPAVVKQ
ncbi:MAG TPA: SUMF1/EgtB/PvdO family nonheme iron enzyme [Spirochaetales bacterium]|nr:SUMF1/EgtB/PvdO family nonheme iron enzyme [Spirochaetales bacterium]